jgi:hypothetical protein
MVTPALPADVVDVARILDAGHPLLYRLAVLAATALGGQRMWRDARGWPLPPRQRTGLLVAILAGTILGCALPALIAGGLVGDMAASFLDGAGSVGEGVGLELLLGPKTVLGGMLFGFFGAAAYKRWRRIDYDTSDAFAAGGCLMMAIGRLGCIAQHCCFGIVVAPWLGVDLGDGRPRFPVQAVEAAAMFALFAVLRWAQRHRVWEHRRLFVLFFAYGVLRFELEFLREPIAATWLGLGPYQWLAAVVGGVGLYQIARRSHQAPVASVPCVEAGDISPTNS